MFQELHAHLNGSISFETLEKLHKLRGDETECIPIPDISNFQTLKEYDINNLKILIAD